MASMGPPLFSGGNRPRNEPTTPLFRRFNGAAAFQRRKSAPRSRRASTPPGFNGAAAFQRRKWRNARPSSRSLCVPSMGPPLFSGGNPATRTPSRACFGSFNGAAAFQRRKCAGTVSYCSAAKGLQWGRRFSAAEIGYPSPFIMESDPTFNGAAAFQRRKWANSAMWR